MAAPEPERDIITWIAPARPFKRRDRQFYVTTFAIAGVVGLILFLAEGIMPVLLIVSLVFLYYVLSTVQPENIEYKVTNKGVRVAGILNEWPSFTRFWFAKKLDSEVLIFETIAIPGRLEMVIKPEIKEDLKKNIVSYVTFEEAPLSGFDKIAGWAARKLPGNS